ncbi:MAG TPA: hypothetical protein VFE75_12165, partial [Rhodanobacter sp.]|nr:hypothetical protein [Rhodanobacter sp.]
GASLQVASGRPKNCIGNAPADPDGAWTYDRQNYGASFFYCDYDVNGTTVKQLGTRGTKGRLPWTYELNLSAQYTPAWADHKLAFTADVFNVFTQQRKVSVVETQNSVDDVNYGRVISYQTPRTVRLGVRYDFSL